MHSRAGYHQSIALEASRFPCSTWGRLIARRSTFAERDLRSNFRSGWLCKNFAVGLLFYIAEIRPVVRAQRVTDENKDRMDAIERAARQLGDLALNLKALAVANADQILDFLDKV